MTVKDENGDCREGLVYGVWCCFVVVTEKQRKKMKWHVCMARAECPLEALI